MVFVDEIAELVAAAGDEEDELRQQCKADINSLVRLGRAAGVHLVLATQRPDAEFIPGATKSNIGARLAMGSLSASGAQMALEATPEFSGISGRGWWYQTGQPLEQVQVYYTGDGCDTRNAALLRDAAPGTEPTVGDYCDVEKGKWVDPYTGNAYTDPGDMDIDHVVALGNAWRSGASRWTDADREAFANDPAVLLTAEDNANQEKGDKGPEAWVPPNSNYHCFYARHWISIKSDYALTVNPQEKGALREMLATCA